MKEQQIPADPMSELMMGAAAAHELFISFVSQGFNEQQALYLVGQMITSKPQGSQG